MGHAYLSRLNNSGGGGMLVVGVTSCKIQAASVGSGWCVYVNGKSTSPAPLIEGADEYIVGSWWSEQSAAAGKITLDVQPNGINASAPIANLASGTHTATVGVLILGLKRMDAHSGLIYPTADADPGNLEGPEIMDDVQEEN